MLKIQSRMSTPHMEYVKNLVGPDVVVETGNGRINKHAPAAVERLLMERSALKEFARDTDGIDGPVLLDVYSNAVRISQSRDLLGLNFRLEHLIPHVVPNDLHRQSAAKRAGIEYSTDVLNELIPLRPGEGPKYHGLNFTHAIYYVPVETLARVMVEQNVMYAYATMHDFNHASASLCAGTVKYHYDSAGLIACRADGDDTVYSHSACHWIQTPGISLKINGVAWKLSWCVVDKIGDTILRRFVLEPGQVPLVTLYPDLDIIDTADPEVNPLGRSLNFTTVLNRELKSTTVDLAYVPIVDAVFFYDLVGFTTGKGRFIPVPRGLIGRLRMDAAGQKRCPALYQLLLARAKNAVGQLNFPADMQSEVAVFSAVCALVIDVEFETSSLGSANRLFHNLFIRHGRVLDFEPVYLYTARQLTVAGGFAATTIVPLHYYHADALILGALKSLTIVAAAHPFIAVPIAAAGVFKVVSGYRAAVMHQSEAARAWLRFRENLAPGPVGRTIMFDSCPTFKPAFTPKTRSDAPLKHGAKLKIYGNPEYNPPRGLDRAGLKLCGIAIQQATPSYIQRDVSTSIQGLKSRILAAPKYTSQFEYWAALLKKMEQRTTILSQFYTGPLRNYNDGTFEHWVSRFPAQVQQRLREAKTSLLTEPLCDRDLKVEGIVKQEKSGVIDITGEAPVTDTRIVLSCSPRANAYLGPFHWSVSNVYKKRFYPRPGKYLVWSCCETSEELGAWFDWAENAYSRPGKPCVFLFGDQSRFEKNQGHHVHIFERNCNRECGADQEFLNADRKLKTVSGHMQGQPVSFALAEENRVSGGNDTSSANFKTNSAGIVHSVGEPGPDTYAVAVKGDDFVAVGFPEQIEEPDILHAKMAQLGLDCEFNRTFDKSQVEFASNLPYPSADGTVWGPKIGRVLHRFGWTLSSAPPDVYGAATSLMNTTNHIPFLRQFVDAHRRLASPSEKSYFSHKMLAEAPHSATAETYAFIAARYGLNGELEKAFEERLSEVTSLPASIDWPLISELVARDA